MGELFKLPVLIAHYFEHDEKDDHQSFFAFIKEHYAEMHATESQMHADHQQNFGQSHSERMLALIAVVHSERRLYTGLAIAALIDCTLIVISVINTARIPPFAKIHQLISIL